MKSLGAKFSEKQLEDIAKAAEVVGVSVSKLSRAALRLGLAQVSNLAVKDLDKAIDLVLVNDARSK